VTGSRPAPCSPSRLVRDVDCYRMTIGDLDDAVAAVEALAGS